MIIKFFLLELITKFTTWLKEDVAIATIVLIVGALLIGWYAGRRNAKFLFAEKYKALKQRHPHPLDTLRDLKGYAQKGKQLFTFDNLRLDIYEQGMIVGCSGYAQWIPYEPQYMKLEEETAYRAELVINIPSTPYLNKRGQLLQEEWEEKADKLDLQISENLEKQIEAQAAGEKSKARAFDKKVDKSMEAWLEAKSNAQRATWNEYFLGIFIPPEKRDLIKRVVLKQMQD